MAKRSPRVKGSKIGNFRQSKNWTRGELAARLEVTEAAVGAWERGEYGPSAETYIRLANLAVGSGSEYLASFLEEAGLSVGALDSIAAVRTKNAIPLPTHLKNFSSAEFVTLQSSGKRFAIRDVQYSQPVWPSPSDLLLIDPTAADLREIREGAFIVVRIQDGTNYHDYAGTLKIRKEVDHTQYWLWMPDDSKYLGTSVKGPQSGPVRLPGLDSKVIGVVLAWVIRASEAK